MKKPRVKPLQSITIIRKGKIETLMRPYTPEQAKKFLHKD